MDRFIAEQQLPDCYRELLTDYVLPLTDWLAGRCSARPLLVGINGAQGSGKSTLAAALAGLVANRYGLRTAIISIDDLYLSRKQRCQLAGTVHPLLITRGVPGSHDIALGMKVLTSLLTATVESRTALPRFDKADDERLPEQQWPLYCGRPDIILFEGWCVATPAQPAASLRQPVNDLEAAEDSDGIWRGYVNNCLHREYQQLFAMLDGLLLLQAPDFDTVFHWRALQEEKLRNSRPDAEQLMGAARLERFIRHFERLTRYNLDRLPAIADVILRFDSSHRVISMQGCPSPDDINKRNA